MVHQSHNLQLKKDKLGNKQDGMICIPYTLHMEEDRPCEYGGHMTWHKDVFHVALLKKEIL